MQYELGEEYDRLRDYQLDCVIATFDKFNYGDKSTIAVLPMAAGKTVIVGAVLKRYLDRHPKRKALMLSHLDVLTVQNEESLREFWGLKTGILQASKKPEWDSRCIISTMQSYKDSFKRKRWGKEDDIGICVVDETHLFGSESYDKIIESLPPDCLILGVTATPFRDNKDMTNMFDSVAYTISMQELIDKNMLVPPILNHLPIVKDEDIKSIYNKLIMTYRYRHNGEKSIIFMRTIEQCTELQNLFLSAGISAKAVTSKFTGKKRYECIDDFKANEEGSADVLITVGVLTAGFSSDNVRSIMMPFPVSSVAAYLQRIGRGMRLDVGKDHVDIYVGGSSPKLTKEKYERMQKAALNAGRAQPSPDPAETPEYEREFDDEGVRYDSTTLVLSNELNEAGMKELSKHIRKKDFPQELLDNLVSFRKVKSPSMSSQEPRASESVFLKNHGVNPEGLSRIDAVYLVAAMLQKLNYPNDSIVAQVGKHSGVPYKAIPPFYKKLMRDKKNTEFLSGNYRNKSLYSVLENL